MLYSAAYRSFGGVTEWYQSRVIVTKYHGRTSVTGSRIRFPRRRAGAAPSLRFLCTRTVTRMVVPAIEEDTEPVAKAEEEQVITLVVDIAEGQMDAPGMDMEKDLAALFGDNDFEDDASDGFDDKEVWEVNEDWLMAPTTPPPMLTVPSPSVYEVGGPSTAAAEGPSFPHSAPRLLVSDAEVAAGCYPLGSLARGSMRLKGPCTGPTEATQRDEMIVELTQQVQTLQIDVQQRDTQIEQLQTTVTKMGSGESTMMWCILGLERRIATLERRPPGPSSPISILF
ncbi:hypothetical protein Tco_1294439 [Tanacetum coccineum]